MKTVLAQQLESAVIALLIYGIVRWAGDAEQGLAVVAALAPKFVLAIYPR